ncbi:hypothetical protein [Roseateles sp. P5_E7]
MTTLPLFRCAAVALALAATLAPVRADTARTPRDLIDRLGVDIRQILEDAKSTRTPEDAERDVAEQITALIRADENHLSLTLAAQGPRGGTPLMVAASMGYVQVVRALLTSPGVKLTVDVADASGETAWMKASFAPAITLAACQPGALTRERFALMPPYLLRMAHLMKTQAAAYVETLAALEAAGAAHRTDQARLAWLTRCPNATAELRQSLTGAELLPTLVNAAVAQQIAFGKASREALSSLPVRPPKDMRFIGMRTAERATLPSPLQRLHETLCLHMVKPEVPRVIYWRGELLFKATVSTRAGVVETADIDVLESSGDRKNEAADFFRLKILQALAGYQCVGDFVFEQEFRVKVD